MNARICYLTGDDIFTIGNAWHVMAVMESWFWESMSILKIPCPGFPVLSNFCNLSMKVKSSVTKVSKRMLYEGCSIGEGFKLRLIITFNVFGSIVIVCFIHLSITGCMTTKVVQGDFMVRLLNGCSLMMREHKFTNKTSHETHINARL